MRRGCRLMICEWWLRDGVATQGAENGGAGYNCDRDESENGDHK